MPHLSLVNVHHKATPLRRRWSSIVALGMGLAALFGVTPVTLAAQTPTQTQAQLDSIKQRLEDAEAALQALREQVATEASTALRTRSRVSLEFTGRALMHVVRNDGRVNNVDVPTFARPDSGTGPQGGMAMTIRQTTLGLAFTASDIAGGTFRGDIDADFYGGQQPSSGGRTFPLVRLRTARGTLSWTNGFVMAGQEQPLITNLDPVSLASVGVPGFTAAGNLWLWLPQIRGGVHTSGRVRFGVEAAVLAPTSGEPAGLFDTQFDAAERTDTPYLQGQLRMEWGEEERRGFVTAGYHTGRVADATDVARTSEAIAATVKLPIGSRLDLRGEFFDGQLLRGLGGGGIGQGFGAGGVPVRTQGLWAQLNVQASTRVLLGVGGGYDDPEDADLAAGARVYNSVAEAHLHWRPAGPIVLGLEWRRLATEYLGASTATNTNHLNLAFGFEF
jgi:hypothetical protein